jgi:hypothetical protein
VIRLAVALASGLLAVTLVACGALDPYPAAPHTAPAGAPPGQRVAICYNTLTTTLAEVQTQAQQECPADTAAEPAGTDWYLQSCPLLLPARATFTCKPKR